MSQRVVNGTYRTHLVRPHAAPGTWHEKVIALACGLTLLVIFLLEVATPDYVISGMALLPLTAAMWMLSDGLAGTVTTAGVMFFAVAAGVDKGNRLTLVLIALPILVTVGLVRLYAVSLAAKALDDAPHEPSPSAVGAGDDDGTHSPFRLTGRELEVARLAARAYTAAEIGQELHIGERTVESHIATAYLKLGIRSRPELIRLASRLG